MEREKPTNLPGLSHSSWYPIEIKTTGKYVTTEEPEYVSTEERLKGLDLDSKNKLRFTTSLGRFDNDKLHTGFSEQPMSVDEAADTGEVSAEGYGGDIEKENELLKQYLSAQNYTEEQIDVQLAKPKGSRGRDTLLRKALEWNIYDENSLYGRVRLSRQEISDYLTSIRPHVPENMLDEYNQLLDTFNSDLKPDFEKQEQLLLQQPGATSDWGDLKAKSDRFYGDIEDFYNKLNQTSQGNPENTAEAVADR